MQESKAQYDTKPDIKIVKKQVKEMVSGASNRGVGPDPEGRRTIRQYKPYLGCQKLCRTEHWTKVEKGVGPSVATVHNVAASD